MKMTSHGISELSELVDCKYSLVVAVSKRAHELVDKKPAMVDYKIEDKPVTISVEEFVTGKFTYELGQDK